MLVQVGAHVERIVELGCCDYETAVVDKRTGSAQFELVRELVVRFREGDCRRWQHSRPLLSISSFCTTLCS